MIPDEYALMPRIEAAVRAAVVNRFEVEFVYPECHKPRCKEHRMDAPKDAFSMMKDQILDSIRIELLCKAITEPDE